MELWLMPLSQNVGGIFLVNGEFPVLFNTFATENINVLFLIVSQLELLIKNSFARKTDFTFTL